MQGWTTRVFSRSAYTLAICSLGLPDYHMYTYHTYFSVCFPDSHPTPHIILDSRNSFALHSSYHNGLLHWNKLLKSKEFMLEEFIPQ